MHSEPKEPYEEKIDVTLTKCDHKGVKYLNGELKCTCGASWSGPQLHKLYTLLTS